MSSGVYALRCIPTGQCYVGTGIDWQKRISSQISKLDRRVHKNKKLQAAWDKYGGTEFEFKLLEACPVNDLLICEKKWSAKFNSYKDGFNAHTLGSNGHLTHGQTHTRTFKTWGNMIQRCTNENSPDYYRYGGVGIKVCDRWKEFINFLEDMGERPEGKTLDRYPDKAGNYEPGNCRWATAGEQQRNVKSNLYIEYGGKLWISIDLANEKGIPVDLLRQRYHAGMRGDELFAPSYSRYEGDGKLAKRRRLETRDIQMLTFGGKTQSITEWANQLGLTRNTLDQRINKYKMP